MITGAEVATVAKVGSSVTQGIKTALNQQPSKWPNLHEALMELYVILDDWCGAAEESNRAAHRSLEARTNLVPPPIIGKGAVMNTIGPAHLRAFGITFGGYVERATGDIKDVLNPSTPWYTRWRRSENRVAARRTLRSMLRIYCAELLDAFEAAAANRANWVVEHRRKFKDTLEDPTTDLHALQAMVDQMDETLGSLQSVRNNLYQLIHENFPLKATMD
jgi:hypothetical protein